MRAVSTVETNPTATAAAAPAASTASAAVTHSLSYGLPIAPAPVAPRAPGLEHVPYIASIEACLETDFDEDMRDAMLATEIASRPDPRFMENQPNVSTQLRTDLVDWMADVCQEYSLGRETFHLAINCVDRYMSLVHNLRDTDVQLIGATCLFITSKLDEIHAPKCQDFANITDGAVLLHQLHETEIVVLSTLQWRLCTQTPYAWVKILAKCGVRAVYRAANGESLSSATEDLVDALLCVRVFARVMDIIDAAVHDVRSLEFLPSQLAASALLLVVPDFAHFLPACLPMDRISLDACLDFLQPLLALEPCALLMPEPRYIELRVMPADMFTRQTRNPLLVDFLRRL